MGFGAMLSSMAGMNAFDQHVSVIADNVANIGTSGYKSLSVDFSTLVTSANQMGSLGGRYSSGGVTTLVKQDVKTPGLIQATNSVTDISINGEGFLPVNTAQDSSGKVLFTREGSFTPDNLGNLKNKSGNYLVAWPLDNNENLPGQGTNTNTASYSLLESLTTVNINSISGSASKTTNVDVGVNLLATQANLAGGGGSFAFSEASPNYKNSEDDVIINDVSFNQGDAITFSPYPPGQVYSFTYGGVVTSSSLNNTLGASQSSDAFNGADGDGFKITTKVNGRDQTYSYKFVASNPNVDNGEFNSLSSLAQSINSSTGLSARVYNNKLYIANNDANNGITFSNNTGATNNFVTLLGLQDMASAANGTNRFATLQDLSSKVSSSTSMSASVLNPKNGASVKFNTTNAMGTLAINAVANNPGDTPTGILNALGIDSPTTYQANYVANDPMSNFAGKKVTPAYTQDVTLYDALGTGHNFKIAFAKVKPNEWAVEIYATEASEIVSDRTDGMVASGLITFNGDGTLRNVDPALSAPIAINWANQALQSSITFNWGEEVSIGSTSSSTVNSSTTSTGLTQTASPFQNYNTKSNGSKAGTLNGIQIDDLGNIIAQFTNGTTRKIYQIPLVTFTSPNRLQQISGNHYQQTEGSGVFNLNVPNTGSAGKIASQSIEGSNVELAEQLTKMITAQRGYEACAKVTKAANELLQILGQLYS